MQPRPFVALLPAAGSGTRFGAADKLLIDLAGQSVLQRSVALFARRPDVALILIVTSPDRIDPYREHLGKTLSDATRLAFTPGGRHRWESVLFGLRYLAAQEHSATHVAIHDAARPLTPAAVIDEAFRTALAHGAALPCVPEPATLKKADPQNRVAATVDRRGLFQAQTPQCFHLPTLLAAYEKLLAADQLADVTDDAQIFERTGHGVPITPGDSRNLKITTPPDLALAQALLKP